MGLFDSLQRLSDTARAKLLTISTYTPPATSAGPDYDIDSPIVERIRRALGGQLAPPTTTQTRWYIADLESAERSADTGDLSLAGKLMLAARKDGHLSGVLSTRTGGLVRLPKKFRGDKEVRDALEAGHDSVRSVFDEMLPASELALLAADGMLLGVGVAELLRVQGRDYPVLCRLDPQYLSFVWSENRWYYRAAVGRLPITPGDGRWVLHSPGGRIAPWSAGLWRCIARAYIRKEHALLHKDEWSAKLAHPARVAVAPQGASVDQKQSWFQQVMAWGINSVFGMTPGYDVKLVESNGRGWESFDKTVEAQNDEFIIAVAGQKVTTDGGAGFQNSDVHKSIRADLIKETADGLAHTVNTQCLPVFIVNRFGEEALDIKPCSVEWDVTPPKDRNSEATSLVSVANAITMLATALAADDIKLDVDQMCTRFAVPVKEQGEATDDIDDTIDNAIALNGAQVTSLLEVINYVAQAQLPRDAALAIIQVAFNVDAETAAKMMGSVGAGFVPAPLGEAKPPAAPPPAAPPSPAELPS